MRRLTPLLLAFLLGTAPFAARAVQINFPPPGSRSFISMYEISSPHHTCPDVQCNIVSSFGVPLELPQATFSNGQIFETGFGSLDGRSLHAFISGNVGTEIDLAMRDTFTVLGSASGPFPVTFTVSASGIASSVGSQLIFPSISLIIGTFSIDPLNDLVPTVYPFDPNTTKAVGMAPNILSGGGSEPISATLVYTRMVSVGDVFDLGFEVSAASAKGTVDISHTATISIQTPPGVFLDSVLAPVPEPATRLSLVLGAGLLWGLRRRRR